MKLVTNKLKIENPTKEELQNALLEARKDAKGGFLILEKKSDEFIQAIPLLKEEKYNLEKVDNTKEWYIEKPLNGLAKYVVNCSNEKAIELFGRFLEGEKWENLTKWEYVVEKEKPIKLTEKETVALKNLIDSALNDFKQLDELELKEFYEELKEMVEQKQEIPEGFILVIGSYLSGYLEGKKQKELADIYKRCKERDSNIP